MIRSFIFPVLFGLILSASCNNNKDAAGKENNKDTLSLTDLTFTIERDQAWTRLFQRSSGWFGGDGIFCLTLSGNEQTGAAQKEETLVWFSDTVIGEIKDSTLQSGYSMINNSVAYIQNGQPDSATIRFEWDKTPEGKPASVFIPQTPATQSGEYYWLGDGFVNHKKNKDIYLFGYRITNTAPNAAGFGFKEMGNTLIVIPAGSTPPFAGKRQIDIPFFLGRDVNETGSFGAGILVNTQEAGAADPDGYVYIYGVRGPDKQVMVARVLPENIELFDSWRFRDGKNWTANLQEIKPVAERASNELSVSRLEDGRYVMIFQEDGIGKYVSMRLGSSPAGPFGPIIHLMDVSGDLENDKDIFPYNAKAHPVLSKPGELLISYNVNSFDFFNDIKTFPYLYRPRFISMKYDVQ